MKKIIAALAVLILCACSPQPAVMPVTTPSALPLSVTATAIPPMPSMPRPGLTSTRMPRPTHTPSPTNTPFPPYPTKQVLFEYTETGWNSIFDLSGISPIQQNLHIVIYTDGQMIQNTGTLQQKILTPAEIEDFLAHLDALGFSKLESNMKHDPTDRLYTFGSDFFQVYDAVSYCVTVNREETKKICAYGPFQDYLVPEMKNILKSLDHYYPEGTTQYIPDRFILMAEPDRDPNYFKLPKDPIPWPDSLPSVETVKTQKFIYAEGDTAREIISVLGNESPSVVIQNGREYTVVLKVIFPHETIINPPNSNLFNSPF